MVVVFYFLLIRPQQKKEKEILKMISALKNGDRVLTVGGIYGVISSIKDDDIVVLKISNSTTIEVARSAIQAKV
jgi:preprotein translocase subunit YajC